MAFIAILSGLIRHMNKAVQDSRVLFILIRQGDAHIFLEKMRQILFSQKILCSLSSEHTRLSSKVTKCIIGTVSKIFQL